ncbi:MAG: oligosaccharide flippase family protein [Lachnospiraceae bacterium]|nr:oligosaccharide flippase family protein [Lachnospiraceae bacterium]
MSIRRTLIKGTFLLTAAGMISRLIGFYYRVFLTHAIGAEGIGIYQLIFPVYALCHSLSSAGIQTAVSRLVAANDTKERRDQQFTVYRLGLVLSVSLAAAASLFLYFQADWIAVYFLQEERCSSLLRILAYALPLSAVHSVVCGYYYGIKNASIPSLTQLAEQIVRVGGVFLIVEILRKNQSPITIDLAVWGLVLGEATSTLFSVTAVKFHMEKVKNKQRKASENVIIGHKPSKAALLSLLLRQSVPLTMNRLFINLLQSVEAILIPSMLKQYGLSTGTALSTYGILTGMALPLILFPSALTNSVSVMLLPTIAQAQAEQKTASIQNAVEQSLKYCLLLGIYCTGIFLFLGNDMGMVLYHNEEAGRFIVTLAWICPFLYITTTLGSIVHGLGKTFLYFVYNSISLLIRIGFVTFSIPRIGILGYLWGILASQLFLTLLLLRCLNREYQIHFRPARYILVPVCGILVSISLCRLLDPILDTSLPPFAVLCSKGMLVTLVYIGFAWYYGAFPSIKKLHRKPVK